MDFEVRGGVRQVEVIAKGRRVRNLKRLRKVYGGFAWRKCKGVGRIRFADGRTVLAELHWYECHGVGRKEIKIKRFLGEGP